MLKNMSPQTFLKKKRQIAFSMNINAKVNLHDDKFFLVISDFPDFIEADRVK